MSDRAFYPRWIAACAAAELIGIGAAAGIAVAIGAVVGEPHTTASRLVVLAAMTAAGAIEGAALGWLEWRMLRRRLPLLRAGAWVGTTVAIAVIGWVVGMSASLFRGGGDGAVAVEPGLARVLVMAAVMGGAAGAVFGGAQWLVLRRYAPHAGRWIAIHVPAWAAAMAAIFLGASVPESGWPAWAVGASGAAGGLCGGLLLGAITGLVARTLEPWGDRRVAAEAGA
jgi:hypothetical protein